MSLFEILQRDLMLVQGFQKNWDEKSNLKGLFLLGIFENDILQSAQKFDSTDH